MWIKITQKPKHGSKKQPSKDIPKLNLIWE